MYLGDYLEMDLALQLQLQKSPDAAGGDDHLTLFPRRPQVVVLQKSHVFVFSFTRVLFLLLSSVPPPSHSCSNVLFALLSSSMDHIIDLLFFWLNI